MRTMSVGPPVDFRDLFTRAAQPSAFRANGAPNSLQVSRVSGAHCYLSQLRVCRGHASELPNAEQETK
jgi:hypothetical protein